MSSMVRSHSRATSGSGSGWSAIATRTLAGGPRADWRNGVRTIPCEATTREGGARPPTGAAPRDQGSEGGWAAGARRGCEWRRAKVAMNVRRVWLQAYAMDVHRDRGCAELVVQVGVALERRPPLEELPRLHRLELAEQHLDDAAGVAGEQVPVEDRLALVDVDDLDVVDPVARCEPRGRVALATDDEPVARLCEHQAATRCAPSHTAGTSRTPSAIARAVALCRAPLTPRRSAAFITAVGCISHAAAAITTLSGSASERPPANAWRYAASAKATVRPICLAYVATRIAKRLSKGKGSGQRSGCSPAATTSSS